MSNDGVYIPKLEVEKFRIAKNGAGFRFHESGRLQRDWRGCSPTGGTNTEGRLFLYATSSDGWLKVNIISGSTFGPTGAAYYIPLFKYFNTYTYN